MPDTCKRPRVLALGRFSFGLSALIARCGAGLTLSGRRVLAATTMLAGLLARLLSARRRRRIAWRCRRRSRRGRGGVAGLREGLGSGDRKREEGNAGETLERGHEKPQMVGDRPVVAGLVSVTRARGPPSPRHLDQSPGESQFIE